jgi:4-diphosphocytidyl-2-C-methyl-D-erythritol kinase
MICFPHAKINLGLSIVSKRPDGYHNLETIFYPLPIYDILEAVPAAETGFFLAGYPIPGKKEDNLVFNAYRLLKSKYAKLPPLHIYLYKAIPMNAGLGGGSSDAAEMIRLIHHLLGPSVSERELSRLALELGSDCPFFMQQDPCFSTGRGEILEPINLDLSSYSLLLVHPEVEVETAWAFSRISPSVPSGVLKESIKQPIENWKKTISNDFESPVFEVFPSLQKIKELLYATGAKYASMTGSGSTIYGIYPKDELPVLNIENARFTYLV